MPAFEVQHGMEEPVQQIRILLLVLRRIGIGHIVFVVQEVDETLVAT